MHCGHIRRAAVRWFQFARMGKTPATVRNYRELASTILRLFPDVARVELLTRTDFQNLARRFNHYSPARFNGILQALRWINPAAQTIRRRALKPTRPPPPTPPEFAALINAARQLKRSHAAPVINFLAHTGLRITAARNLTWRDVHQDRIEYISKGGRRCAVPIVAGLRPILEELRAIQGNQNHVLPRPAIRNGLDRARRAAGLRHFTHHDFRHLFITRCIESGVDVPTVARWAGHKDGGALIATRYFHLLDGHSRHMAARVTF